MRLPPITRDYPRLPEMTRTSGRRTPRCRELSRLLAGRFGASASGGTEAFGIQRSARGVLSSAMLKPDGIRSNEASLERTTSSESSMLSGSKTARPRGDLGASRPLSADLVEAVKHDHQHEEGREERERRVGRRGDGANEEAERACSQTLLLRRKYVLWR